MTQNPQRLAFLLITTLAFSAPSARATGPT